MTTDQLTECVCAADPGEDHLDFCPLAVTIVDTATGQEVTVDEAVDLMIGDTLAAHGMDPLAERLPQMMADTQLAVFGGPLAELAAVTPEEAAHARQLLAMADVAVIEGDGSGEALPDITVDYPLPPAVGQTSLFPDIEAEARSLAKDLTTRFGVPPFSVLRADAGYWQDRKAMWLQLGIQSELGRGEEAISINMDSGQSQAFDEQSRRAADQRSNLTGAAALPGYATNGTEYIAPGTSIFDPVLCELAYRWWLPTHAGRRVVLDPFAGGSVRGIVAAICGAAYIGVDLSAAQVAANYAQSVVILPEGADEGPRPVWVPGDSRAIRDHIIGRPDWPPEGADLIFSCPPYYDLEVYSEDPADLSRAEDYGTFLAAYSDIIRDSLSLLAENRFAVWVVGEVRDRKGYQRGLVADTIRIFQTHGAELYNEAVLVTPAGTLALRAPRAMNATRKLARGHQSVLVFWKGTQPPSGWPDVIT